MFVPYSGVRVTMCVGQPDRSLIPTAVTSADRQVRMGLPVTGLPCRLVWLRPFGGAVVSEPSEGLLGQTGPLGRERALQARHLPWSLTCRSSSARAMDSNPVIS